MDRGDGAGKAGLVQRRARAARGRARGGRPGARGGGERRRRSATAWARRGWWSSVSRARRSRARSCATREWAAARAVLTAQCGRAVAAHPHDRSGCHRRAAAGRSPGRPAALSSTCSARRARRSSSARAGWRAHRAGARAAGDRARRLPARQPAGRSRRPARRPRLGAGPRRRSRGGHRVAVRSGLALRGPRRGRRLRRASAICSARTRPRVARRSMATASTGGRSTPR